jgi:hypothetical protein
MVNVPAVVPPVEPLPEEEEELEVPGVPLQPIRTNGTAKNSSHFEKIFMILPFFRLCGWSTCDTCLELVAYLINTIDCPVI